eukprot:3850027-Pyramimonas_sp.AAC.1
MSGGSRSNVLPGQMHIERDYFTDGTEPQLRSVFRTWSLSSCKEWLESPEQVRGGARGSYWKQWSDR